RDVLGRALVLEVGGERRGHPREMRVTRELDRRLVLVVDGDGQREPRRMELARDVVAERSAGKPQLRRSGRADEIELLGELLLDAEVHDARAELEHRAQLDAAR